MVDHVVQMQKYATALVEASQVVLGHNELLETEVLQVLIRVIWIVITH